MAITDNLAFNLRASSGETVPTDLVAAQTLTGTVSLYDDPTYSYLWRIAAGNNIVNSALTGQGTWGEGHSHTIAFRFRLTGRAANYQRWMIFGWDTNTGSLLGNQGSGSGSLRWGQMAGGSMTGLVNYPTISSGVVRTLVMRFTMGGTDTQDVWYNTTGRVGTAADGSASTSFSYGVQALDTLRFLADTGETLDVLDFVHWTRSCTDEECAALADDLRGTLAVDATAPVLSSPTGTATGSTTATVGATTDEGNGTLYAFVSTSATPPSATDLKAGTGATWSGSVAVSSTGAKTLNATGLTASTGYYAHLIHTDAAANDSNIVTSAQFTTDAPGGGAVTPKAFRIIHG